MSRLEMYHSLVAVLRKDRDGKAFVRVLDRDYPGPPGPEYTTVVNALDPYEARALAHELIIQADRADKENSWTETKNVIASNTAKIAALAKAESE